jgi:hypothetical protein
MKAGRYPFGSVNPVARKFSLVGKQLLQCHCPNISAYLAVSGSYASFRNVIVPPVPLLFSCIWIWHVYFLPISSLLQKMDMNIWLYWKYLCTSAYLYCTLWIHSIATCEDKWYLTNSLNSVKLLEELLILYRSQLSSVARYNFDICMFFL